VHWSAPLGALFFSGFRFAPGAWAGFILLILVHELGHAFLAMRYRLRVRGIDVHGLGGQCRYEGGGTRRQHIVIAWGGVLAQAVVLLLAVTVLRPVSTTPFTQELAETFVGTNVWLIALNLLPIPPLDGATAWQRFFRITVPLMKPAILVAVLFRTLDSFRIFDNIFILTGGNNGTESVSILGWDNLFNALNLGIGSTISILIFICVVIIAAVFIKGFGTAAPGTDIGKR